MRILLGFILALSVSFACDQPYEEVGGYKIGCPLESKEGLDKIAVIDENNVAFYEKKITGVFDTVIITTIGEVIDGVIFGAGEQKEIQKEDGEALLVNLEKRWGDFKKDGSEYTFRPNNDIIDNIYYTFSPKMMTLSYESKMTVELKQRVKEQRNKEKQEEFSKF